MKVDIRPPSKAALIGEGSESSPRSKSPRDTQVKLKMRLEPGHSPCNSAHPSPTPQQSTRPESNRSNNSGSGGGSNESAVANNEPAMPNLLGGVPVGFNLQAYFHHLFQVMGRAAVGTVGQKEASAAIDGGGSVASTGVQMQQLATAKSFLASFQQTNPPSLQADGTRSGALGTAATGALFPSVLTNGAASTVGAMENSGGTSVGNQTNVELV